MIKLKANLDVIIEKDEDGYFIASIPELPGCHTQAKTLDELMERIKEAAELYLEESKVEIPSLKRFIGIQRVEVAV